MLIAAEKEKQLTRVGHTAKLIALNAFFLNERQHQVCHLVHDFWIANNHAKVKVDRADLTRLQDKFAKLEGCEKTWFSSDRPMFHSFLTHLRFDKASWQETSFDLPSLQPFQSDKLQSIAY